ncbi:MAG: SLBB domain-containing protein [Candidatus Cloacimonadaceae bacterium]|jgi:protein involved in polysaccharide export with SLBB domain|nr:SLBB domain-containing protein [Candidatus Cloacimonadota bacterium]MDX9950228.1 SLBB domain-containing protein [Candidatus Syntrophosphaera sp.]
MKTRFILVIALVFAFALSAQTLPQPGMQTFISVNVTGFVANPGTYQVTSLSRVSDAIRLAGTSQTTALAQPTLDFQKLQMAARDSLFENFQGLRSVRLIRGNQARTYDLMKYSRVGDLEQNPLLKDGDLIQVPPLETSVSIFGEVYFPGEYEFVPGDRLSDILGLAQGFTLAADRNVISIYRYREDSPEFDILRVDLQSQAASEVLLKPHDRISVFADSEHRRAWKITVEGDVRAPGEYLVDENTTLYDVLLLCGGPSSRGNLRSAVFANRPAAQEPDLELQRLLTIDISNMTSMEYYYMLNRIRQFPGRYSIDVLSTWESKGAEANPLLRDGDYLFVPKLMDMVEVSGQVANPGLIPWVEGENYEYYIRKAGGYTNNKRSGGTRVISSASGNWVKPSKKMELNPGDQIYVSEEVTYDNWSRFKDVMLIATQVMTIFLGIRTLTH